MTTKEKVLEILSQNINIPLSGEKLAESCGVSRAAIWKAVNSLRDKGCIIEGTTNGGYILKVPADIFSQESLSTFLLEKYPELKDSHIEAFSQIDSTNTYAKKILSQCGNLRNSDGSLTEAGKKYHKSLIVAESQTSGRGRLGRTFVSPAKTGIYLSIIYAPENGIKDAARFTAFSAVAVCRVIERLFSVETKIKWINDIFINQKKVCGILTEGFTNFESGIIESAIIGIGINIKDNEEIFLANKNAGSIEGKNNKNISRCQLAAEVAGEVIKILEEKPQELIKEYKEKSFLIGKTLTIHPVIGDEKSIYQAKAIDIDEKASLIVELPDGSRKTLNSGEVSLHSEE
ncbi:MAG: biotin--[acetyl-CoA-carboxylase] ligase [Treponema sp.]|nr:biotin--[acetyl-CoA-carboxylase] ligase [Treponema sp.]